MQQGVSAQGAGAQEIDAANFHQSDVWHEVEHHYLHVMADHDYCVACNLKGNGLLQVHHMIPVEFCFAVGREDLTVNPLNMITLCEGPGTKDHHVTLGHLGDFHWYNPDVKQDIVGPWKDLSEAEIKAILPDWHNRRAGAVPLQMSDQQRSTLLALIEETFGPKPPGTWNDWVEPLRQKAHAEAARRGTAPTSQN